ncbi:MAG: hypothetical protein DCO98_12005 [Altererythrobacter sp. XM-24bin4]|nr:MAG: hypothetical protein DCO81_07345 [Candidatus Aquiluna sp. XM-24bin5]PWL23548.1 MAG: hypothetical protein DCO98_12005 [Altererythrobacter sp. XM-24bin4]
MLKRMADFGRPNMSPDLSELRARCLVVTTRMAKAGFTPHVTDPVPDGKMLDEIMLREQKSVAKEKFLNVVWAEKCRLLAKPAIFEQMKRRQNNLFGRFQHIDTVGDKPLSDGTKRLVNLPEDWSYRLSIPDVSELKTLARSLKFDETMSFFRKLRDGKDTGEVSDIQRDALLAMMDLVQDRFHCPKWDSEAVIQFHLEYRCIKGAKVALKNALESVGSRLQDGHPARHHIALASHTARGPAIDLDINLERSVARDIHEHQDSDRPVRLSGLAIELGPETAQVRGVLARAKAEDDLSQVTHVVAEDFGVVNTSSLVVLKLPKPVDPASLPDTRMTKSKAEKYLRSHVSGEEIEIVESLQLSGRNFLARINELAGKINRLRSEIDLGYNRLSRLRREINIRFRRDPEALVDKELVETPDTLNEVDAKRLTSMHGRFFRLLAGIHKLKERRRGIYRTIAGLKKSWFGYVSNIRMRLAQKYDAMVVSEKLDYVTIPIDDVGYKGRTFNRMINNGARSQYTSRADDKLAWKGHPQIKIPSFFTSSTDWRHGLVDKAQRRGPLFKSAADGKTWDADMHGAEMIGRWLVLKPKETASQAVSLAAK